MAKHWTEVLQCSCGMKFRNHADEAKHRHNFPILCRKKPELLPSPQPVLEGYVIHLYCKWVNTALRHHDYWGVEFHGHTRAEARMLAKRQGWKLHRDKTATCPMCAKEASRHG